MRRPVHSGLVGAGADAIRPPVEPVAPPGRKLVAVPFSQHLAELRWGRELDPRRPPFLVPPLHEFRHPWIGRAIVHPDRVCRLAIHEVERVGVVPLQFLHFPAQRFLREPPVAQPRDTPPPQVVEAVPGEQLLSARALPPEPGRHRLRHPAPERVHRHRQEVDPHLRQQVGEQPTDPVDVALHRRRYLDAVPVSQSPYGVQRPQHLLRGHQRRQVVLHPRHIQRALRVPPPEPFALLVARFPQVPLGHPGHFAGPLVPRFVRQAGGGLEQVQRLIDELPVLAETQVLVVGEPDVRVTVVDHV